MGIGFAELMPKLCVSVLIDLCQAKLKQSLFYYILDRVHIHIIMHACMYVCIGRKHVYVQCYCTYTIIIIIAELNKSCDEM